MRPMMFRAVCQISLLVLAATPTLAADKAGDYSVRGAGGQKCSAFVAAVEGNKPELGTYIGYIDASLTTSSRLTAGTFDVSPFIFPGPFAAIVDNICKRAPDQIFEVAVRSGIDALAKARVAQSSPVVEMAVGEVKMNLRSDTLRAVQVKLKSLKLLTIEPDGKFGPATQEALRKYQEANHLPITSLPDPDTVLGLLVRTS